MSRILFWAGDRHACGYYRCELPAAGLANLGHTTRVTQMIRPVDLEGVDVLVGQRVARPDASLLWQVAARSANRPRLVYELDDDVWSLLREPHNPAAATWGPLVPNVEANLACADAVTVSTAPLAEIAARYTSAPVHVVPNAVPDHLVLDWDSLVDLDTGPQSPLTLGWQGSPTHDGDWAGPARPVARWAQRRGAFVRILGMGIPAPLRKELDRHQVSHGGMGWISGDWPRYYRALREGMDIGLAPLAPTEFNRSKSDIRLLEYAALGIPWVGSDYGPYGFESESRGGVLARNVHRWADALTSLVDDRVLREMHIRSGLEWARTRTVSAVAPRWATALGIS